MDYSNRKLTKVEVASFKRAKEVDGKDIVTGTVNVYINAFDGTDYGPNLQVYVSVPIGASPSMEAAENALLGAALGLIKRIAQETPETFRQMEPDPLKPAG